MTYTAEWFTPDDEARLRRRTHDAAERMARVLARETGRCGIHYAHGLTERWCDRVQGHDGPCSGHIIPMYR